MVVLKGNGYKQMQGERWCRIGDSSNSATDARTNVCAFWGVSTAELSVWLKTFQYIYIEFTSVCVLQDPMNQSWQDGRLLLCALNCMRHRFCFQTSSHLPNRRKGEEVPTSKRYIKHAIIWIFLFKQPVGLQSNRVTLASHVNYVNDDYHKCSKRVQLSLFVAWLTSMSAPLHLCTL